MLGEGMVSLGTADVVTDCRKRKSSAKIGVVEADPVLHPQRRGSPVDGALGVAEVHGHRVRRPLDAAELVDEVHVPRRPAELAVGGRLQADLLLHAHHLGDGARPRPV